MRVGQQVVQFLGDVAVVDVERCHPCLERAEHGLQVLVAVVQIDGQMVLAALVAPQLRALCLAPQSL